jgi:hypothetical protein
MVPGRGCPLDYRYGARSLAAPATLHTESLWLAGGLYGNVPALHSLERLFLAERGESALVFNGDFHWFDYAAHNFAAVERGVSRYEATRGNVESELAIPQADAGCGCAYPEWVDEATVARSNRIIEQLRHAAQGQPGAAYGALAKGLLYGAAEFLQVQEYAHVRRWTEEIAQRPAVKRGRMVNRTFGEPASQLHERHDAADFDTRTQDKLEPK